MIRLFLSVLAALWLAGCASDGLEVIEPPAELKPVDAELGVAELWSVDLGAGADELYLTLSPLVDDDRVYAASANGKVRAYDADTGKRLWTVDLAVRINAGPGNGGDLLLFGGDAEVFALDKNDGSVRWQAEVSSEVLARPVRAGDRILIRTVDGNLFALDAGDGRQLWRYHQSVPSLSLRGLGEPAPFSRYAVLGYANGRLVTVDVEDGSPMWEAAVAVPRGRTELERMVDVDSTPVLAEGVAHVGAFQGRVAAVALADGDLIWVRDLPTHHRLGVTEERVFVADDRSDVWALERRAGGTLWRQDALHARKLTAPALQGRYLVVGDLEGYLHWLDQEDGHLAARTRIAWEPVLATPVVIGNRVYAVDTAGNLSAYRVSLIEQ